MKHKPGKLYVLLPIGLIWCATVLLVSRQIVVSDAVRGMLTGIGLGLMALPLVIQRLRPGHK